VVEEYNPVSNTWSVPMERMPTARSGGASGTDGRRIYVAGGEVTTKELVGAFRAIEAYDPLTNSWSKLPSMPMPRHGCAGAVIGNRFYLGERDDPVGGGDDVPRPDALDAHSRRTTSSSCSSGSIPATAAAESVAAPPSQSR
jgi:N-acetylneuraminic acid mutarotase